MMDVVRWFLLASQLACCVLLVKYLIDLRRSQKRQAESYDRFRVALERSIVDTKALMAEATGEICQ